MLRRIFHTGPERGAPFRYCRLDATHASGLISRRVEHGIAMDIALCIITAWVIAVASQVARQPLVLEAADLLHVLDAVEKNLLDERRKVQAEQLEERKEVIP